MSFDSLQHAQKMMDGMLRLSGYVEDVAKWMIQVAKLGNSPHIMRDYCGICISVTATSTVAQVRERFFKAVTIERC